MEEQEQKEIRSELNVRVKIKLKKLKMYEVQSSYIVFRFGQSRNWKKDDENNNIIQVETSS